MIDVKLPDGTWATTAIYAGIGEVPPECADHRWEDEGDPTPPETPEGVPVQMQRCDRCGWMRGRYLGNPHPEEEP
jgi:hypothetical protein